AKESASNVLRVVQDANHPALYTTVLYCTEVTWVAGNPPPIPFVCQAKTRYRQLATPCTLSISEELELPIYRVQFKAPQRAITPGQAIVFYQDNLCLGGGTIQSTE